MSSLANKVVLISGASSGIGEALAWELARLGCHLILWARREDILKNITNNLSKEFPEQKFVFSKCDVTQTEALPTLLTQDLQKLNKALDIVIVNAGVGGNTSGWASDFEITKKIFLTNLVGATALVEACLPLFIKQGYGHVVGISSIASVRGLPQNSAYCGSKAGFSTYLESLRLDLLTQGITVTAIHPGFIATPMTEDNGTMLFLMSAERAAKLISKAIIKKKARYSFPLPMAFAEWFLRVMPHGLFDFALGLLRKRIQVFREKR
ncbi:MAG: SDR family NAD(P)-dependent oxidoreductase [Deltaproteobacteria bacterium]|nr:SDR family NAD(P)-dependent oxidoreductase [Deltaproteobacteria bacterium]